MAQQLLQTRLATIKRRLNGTSASKWSNDQHDINFLLSVLDHFAKQRDSYRSDATVLQSELTKARDDRDAALASAKKGLAMLEEARASLQELDDLKLKYEELQETNRRLLNMAVEAGRIG